MVRSKEGIMRLGMKAAVTMALALAGAWTTARAETYTIAVGMPIAGTYAFVSVPEVNAIKMAVDELNAQHYLGEGNTLAITVADDGNDRGQQLSLVNRAVNIDNALAFLGTANSSIAIATAPVVNQLQIVYFGTQQTAAPLKVGPWFFKVTVDSAGAVAPVAKYAAQKFKPKRPAVLYVRDNDGHVGNMKTFKDYLEAQGYKFVADESVLGTDTDFSAVATKIAGANPDAIWLGANAVQAANIAIQLKQAGVAPDVAFFGTAGLGADYIKAGGAAVENTYYEVDYDVDSQSPMNKAFVANYTKRYGLAPDNWSAVGYTKLMIAARAIKDAMPNPTRDKVREAVMKMKDVPVLLGAGIWNLGPDRIPVYDPPVEVLKNGKYIPAP